MHCQPESYMEKPSGAALATTSLRIDTTGQAHWKVSLVQIGSWNQLSDAPVSREHLRMAAVVEVSTPYTPEVADSTEGQTALQQYCSSVRTLATKLMVARLIRGVLASLTTCEFRNTMSERTCDRQRTSSDTRLRGAR